MCSSSKKFSISFLCTHLRHLFGSYYTSHLPCPQNPLYRTVVTCSTPSFPEPRKRSSSMATRRQWTLLCKNFHKGNPCWCLKPECCLPDAECCRDKIYEHEILDAVTKVIRMQTRCSAEAVHIMESRRKQDESRIWSMEAGCIDFEAYESVAWFQGERVCCRPFLCNSTAE